MFSATADPRPLPLRSSSRRGGPVNIHEVLADALARLPNAQRHRLALSDIAEPPAPVRVPTYSNAA